MRNQRTLHRCVGVFAVAVCAFALPAYARADGATAYGPKVEPALAELAQTAEAAYADERRQRAASSEQAATKLAVDAAELRRQHEEAFRNAELQLDEDFAALQRDLEARFAAARTERARAHRAAVARLKAQYTLKLRKAAKLHETKLVKQLRTRRTTALRSQTRKFEIARLRLNTAFAARQAERATDYASAKAQRVAALRQELEQLDAQANAALESSASSFAAEQRARDAAFAATPVKTIAFGDAISAARDEVGAELRFELELIDAQALIVKLGDLQRLADSPGITRLSLDAPTERTAEPAAATTPFSALASLYPSIVGAPTAWAAGYTGSGVGIAILDSGVSAGGDFGQRLAHAAVPNLQSAAVDSLGHGTFVASVAAGRSADDRYVGIAPGAALVAVNVSRDDTVYSSDVVKGLEWVLANRASRNIRVVVLALAESLPSTYRTSVLDYAVEKLWLKGIVVVVSAGNNGPDTMQFAPGNDPLVITVGASDPLGTAALSDDKLATFSSYGKTLDGHVKPDVVAPGKNVVAVLPIGSTLELMAPDANHIEPGYVRMNGTSVAAPQVAGAAAILLGKNPALTPDQVKWLLTTTARPLDGSTAGVIDIAGALAFTGTVRRANEGVIAATAPLRPDSDDGRRSEFNSSALRDALSWERAAGKLEERGLAKLAAPAWEKAAGLWLDALGVPFKAAIDFDRAGGAWITAGDATKAAAAWERAGRAAERVPVWQPAAAYWGLAAGSWESVNSFEKAALAWEQASQSSQRVASLATATFENKATAWIKAISALENASGSWTKAGAPDRAAAADARRAALREQAIAWANTSWTNTSWTNTSWTNTSWTSGEWLNTSWTNTSWTNTSWKNTSWTNTSWNSSSWD